MTTADTLRGHPFLPSADVLATIPKLYATEDTKLADKIAHLHYFVGACDWFVVEYDPDTGIAFGWADLGDPQNAELGYFSLPELQTITVSHPSGYTVVVERDLHWTPGPIPVR